MTLSTLSVRRRFSALTLCALACLGLPAGPAHARSPRTVTIAAVGHIVLGTDFPAKATFLLPDDGVASIDPVAPLLAYADLALGNIAAPLSERGKVKPGVDGVRRFAFRTPPRYAPVLTRLGLDVVLAANNHVLDFGPDAYDDLIALLDRLRIAHVGRIEEIYSFTKRGITIGVVGFTQPYREDFQSHHDIAAAGELVQRLSAEYDLVVVLVHGGGEGREFMHVRRAREYAGHEYRGKIVEFAHHMVDQGADLIIGYGAHHPRAMELYRGRLIAYSLGNFITYGPFDLGSPNFLSGVLQVTLDREGELADAQLVPLRLRYPGVPGFDPKGWTLSFLRRMSKSDFPESPLAIMEDGSLRPFDGPELVGAQR